MESKWLEDFLSLSRSLNFSRSAEERNVTQPAFSRRIRSLEAWLGTHLINRSSYPTSLTPAGVIFKDVAQELLTKIYATRKLLQADGTSDELVHISAPHALVPKLLSDWITAISADFGPLMPRIIAANTFESLSFLAEGQGCDFAIVYQHPEIPIALPEERYPCLLLRQDTLVPVSATHANGGPIFDLNANGREPIPYIAYPSTLFMGRLVEMILARTTGEAHVEKCGETDLLEAAKDMAIAGRAIAWVPKSVVEGDLASGRLCVAGPAIWGEAIDIRLFFALDNRRDVANRLWAFLKENKRPGTQ